MAADATDASTPAGDAEIKTLTYKDGGKYVGEAKDNMRHGEGVMKYFNGDEYNGAWVDDKQSGRGIYKYSNGAQYDGEWKDGKVYVAATVPTNL